ncbi:MAG: heme-binding domain-containing protein [Blastocatellales bacterium]
MKYVKWTLIGLVIILAAIQVVRPDRTNPPVSPVKTMKANLEVPADVEAIFQRACYDCHSNQTVWPWYSNIAPVSWFVADHVREGRGELSFSEFGDYPAKKADHKLEEICEMVEKDEMPLASYLILHGDARLSEADKQAICGWTKQARERFKAAKSEAR